MNTIKQHVNETARLISHNDLLDHLSVLHRKPNYSVHDFLEDALDIEYFVDSRGYFIGAEVLVSSSAKDGSPTVLLNTKTYTVRGGQDTEFAEADFDDQIGLNDGLRFLFDLTMRRIAD